MNAHKIQEGTRIVRTSKQKASSISVPKTAASKIKEEIAARNEKTQKYKRMKFKKAAPVIIKHCLILYRLQE